MAESLLAAVRHCSSEEPVRSLLSAPHVAAEVNRLGPTGVNALGLAVWRNHAALVEALLEAGADPDMPDSEGGWSALHRALHWGQLRTAAALLRANASLALPDWRGRSPLDLLSAELKEFLEPGDGDVFAWGNGNNYTLGTGSTDVQEHPTRLESLHDQQVVAVSAAKFHSAAVSADGRLLTWGWGRGGRLGHPDAHIHSGEGAVISPLVVAGLGKRAVAAVAAAKHHTVLCTSGGEVWTMGSNRHGQLGYAVDGQPTPRRVSALRQRVVAVAAANKHSVAVTAGGDVYTWGSNVLGQLGYGTSDSSSNATPRLVEAMRGKAVVAAAAAKRHTLVLTAAGEVYCWGHRGVSPRRVQLAGARDAAALSGAPITFHRGHADVARPVAVAICAGAAHSSALTATGVVLTWRSADPALQVQEVGGTLAGKRVVSIAAGKYRTAAVSDEGDVYMWEGRSDYFPAEGRQPGSGSKKPGSASKARPIPGSSGHISLGLAAEYSGSYGSYGAAGSSPPSGSYGSHPRRPASFIERFGREREAAAASSLGPGSFGAATSYVARQGSGRSGDAFEKIQPQRAEGLKRAVSVAVGEKHSLAVQRWSAAQLEGLATVPWLQEAAPAGTAPAAAAAAAEEESWFTQAADSLYGEGSQLATPRELDAEPCGAELAGSAAPSPSPSPGRPSPVRPGPGSGALPAGSVGVPSLQRICEEQVARRLVDPRTCLQVLEYADVAGAEVLRAYCIAVAVCNLDAVLLEAGGAFEELAPHLLAELERVYKLRLAGAGSSGASATAGGQARSPASAGAGTEGGKQAAAPPPPPPPRPGSVLQPGQRPTAAAPWQGDDCQWSVEGVPPGIVLPPALSAGSSSFRDRWQAESEAAAQRLLRTLQKKLQQIEHLEQKAAGGAALDPQQRLKVGQRPVLCSALAALDGGMALEGVQAILRAATAGQQDQEELTAAGAQAPGSSSKAGGRTPASSGKHPKSRSKRSTHKAPPAEQEAAAASMASSLAAAASGAAGADGALLGASPPSSSLVPAFGPAGSAAAAAEQPRMPAAAADQPTSTPPTGQVRSLVGFASSSASDGVAAVAQRLPQQQAQRAGSSGKPKSATKRKGGLSMFLRGELEQGPVPALAVEGSSGSASSPAAPAWGARSAVPAGTTSLKQILDQQAAAAVQQAPQQQQHQTAAQQQQPGPGGQRATPGSGLKSRSALESPSAAAGSSGGSGPVRLSLASFMQTTSPMAVQRRDSASPPPPAWGGAAGSSPPGRRPSLRDIQQEQEALQPPPGAPKLLGTSPPALHRLAAGLPPWRPPAAPAGSGTAGGSAAVLGTSPLGSSSLLGTSPSGRGSSFLAAPVPQHSKWYVPEGARADPRKSLKSIQTEEAALQQLAKKYGTANVRILPKQDRRSPGLPRPGKPSGGGASGGGGTGGAGGVSAQ